MNEQYPSHVYNLNTCIEEHICDRCAYHPDTDSDTEPCLSCLLMQRCYFKPKEEANDNG